VPDVAHLQSGRQLRHAIPRSAGSPTASPPSGCSGWPTTAYSATSRAWTARWCC
jgi:hypothetical protein